MTKTYYIYCLSMNIDEVRARTPMEALEKHFKKFSKSTRGTQIAVPADASEEAFKYAMQQSMVPA